MSASATAEVTRTTPWTELPQWLSAEEAAAYLDCTPWTIYQRIHSGKLPYVQYGKNYKIHRDAFHPTQAQARVTA